MKKILLFLLILFLMPFFDVRAEEILNFDVVATINEDASVDVIETIDYDFGTVQKHGIYRDIPVKYTNATGDNRKIKIDDISVTDQTGVKYTSDVSREGNDLRIKIGDADKYVTGEKKYVISYTVMGALNYFDDHDEFYWNVTGDQWEVPIRTARVTVHAPFITKTMCFSGAYGSTSACYVTTDVTDQDVTFIHEGIVSGTGMTAVIGMPVGTVYKPTIWQVLLQYIMDNGILLVPVGVFFWVLRQWYIKGRDPEGKGVIVPYYDAPENLTAAEVGMVADERVTPKDVSAAIIQLAVNGYIKIKRVDKKRIFSFTDTDYTFVRTEKDASSLVGHERTLFDGIFGPSYAQEKKMSQLKDKFYKDLEKIKDGVEKSIVQKGIYMKNPTAVRTTYFVGGTAIIFAAFFLGGMTGLMYGVAAFLSGMVFMGFGYFMPQRTQKGAIVREEVLGLKMYMETAEKDRINFHNAPEKNPAQFEKLLPYAMALGVEEQWAKQFEDITKSAPDWYDGGGTSFSPVIFAHSMHDFSSANNATMVSTPSSAGSGGSGFSGGGSGGGFGGGGGGSW